MLLRIHANKLLIGLVNSRDRSFKSRTKTTSAKTNTAKFRSRAVSMPRPQSRGLHLGKKIGLLRCQ